MKGITNASLISTQDVKDLKSDIATNSQNIDSLQNTKYAKPISGIPKTDLAQGVQDSLDLADSALQSIDSTTVTEALGFTPYNSTNPDGYTKVESSNTNGNIKIDNVETKVYTLPNDVARTSDINSLSNRIETNADDISNLQTNKQDITDNSLTTTSKMVVGAINELDNDVANNTSDISTINGKIPNQASSSNQLADKDFVNSSINALAAFFITRTAQGDNFNTNAQLMAATTFYSGGESRIPTQNDYTYVRWDESKGTIVEDYTSFTTTTNYIGHYVIYNNEGIEVDNSNKDSLGIVPGTTIAYDNLPTTRYSYQGGIYPNGQWEFQLIVNNSALTAVQMAALNSGITSSLVTQIVTNQNNISGLNSSKQDILVSGTNIKTINSQSILGEGNITTPITTVKIDGTSITSNNESNILTMNSDYNADTNKIATANDLNALSSTIPTNYVTTDTTQTISGEKTFSSDVTFNNNVGVKGTSTGGVSYNLIKFVDSNHILIGDNGTQANLLVFRTLRPVGGYTPDLGNSPNKWRDLYLSRTAYVPTINNGGDIAVPQTSGTIALTSDLADLVTTNTEQEISGEKTFSSGIILSNTIPLKGKTAGDTTYDIVRVTSANNIALGDATITREILAQNTFRPAGGKTIDLGISSNKWSDLYLKGKAYIPTINNGNDIAVPTSGGTMALTSDLPSASNKSYYGTCDSAQTAQVKYVDCPNFVLEEGVSIRVLFKNYQNYNGIPKLNVNNTGAIDIAPIQGNTASLRYLWRNGEIVSFTYNGEVFLVEDGGMATTNYFGYVRLSSIAIGTSGSLVPPSSAIATAFQNIVANYPLYSDSDTYAVGNRVFYNNTAYKCTTAITTPESFDSSHWQPVDDLQTQIDDIKRRLELLEQRLS